jgi:sortase (surface protein transpeptidase)
MSKNTHVANNQIPAKKPYRKIMPFVLITAAVVLLIIAGIQLIDMYKTTTGDAKLPDVANVVTTDDSKPAETQPNMDEYMVSADQPRRILIGVIGVSGLIQKIGLTSSNAISVPTNVHFAGWYTGSAKPGELGLSIIDGHVLGRYNDGIFKNLSNLNSGDVYQIEYGDKSIRNFEVVDVKTLPEKEAALYLLQQREGITHQLNLITCGGAFNASAKTYDDRVVVVSKYID